MEHLLPKFNEYKNQIVWKYINPFIFVLSEYRIQSVHYSSKDVWLNKWIEEYFSGKEILKKIF